MRAKSEPGVADQLRVAELYAEIERLKRMQRAIPFIDPIDVRYNRFEPTIVPRAKAVMFCLMDVSASMGEREKDLAKRFFILLHLFLQAQIRARRHRLHPPHPRGERSRRAGILLRPRDRRHGRSARR